MTESTAVFDRLASTYDEHFRVAHRRLYDDLAWKRVEALLPRHPGLVIDVGCGTGRWAGRLVALGHRVIGIDASRPMASAAAARAGGLPDGSFTVLRADMADVELEAGAADAVLAMGSLQYAADPGAMFFRFATWLAPGGLVAVLVDSLLALVAELVAAGRYDEAVMRATTRRGSWSPPEAAGMHADLHLFSRSDLEGMFLAAGFESLQAAGLLIGFSRRFESERLESALEDLESGAVLRRRQDGLASIEVLADLGKQLLVTGRRSLAEVDAGRR